MNYRLGFCSRGPICKFRHTPLPPSDLPPVSELFTTHYAAEANSLRLLRERPTHYRVAQCPTFLKTGWCSFFDHCNYAHGDYQVRRFKGGGGRGGGGGSALSGNKRRGDDFRGSGGGGGGSGGPRGSLGPVAPVAAAEVSSYSGDGGGVSGIEDSSGAPAGKRLRSTDGT